MTRLTKCEKETIILTNEEDNFWNVFTYNKGLQRRFMSFAEQYPENKEPNQETGIPETGDSANLGLWFGLLFISIGSVFITSFYKKKKYN